MNHTPREVVEGRDIEPWPGLKWSRALEHFATLDARVAQWNATRQFKAGLRVADSRTYLELLQPNGQRPPVAEWGLVFGDGVHNLRAALDCMVWEFAHLDDGSPANPKQVNFPVIDEQHKWPQAAQRLGSVPPELLERIEQVQPFRADCAPQPNPLVVLSKLDNDDKHQRVISAVPSPGTVTLSSINLRMGTPIDGEQPFFDTLLNLNEASTGDPFARLGFGIYIDSPSQPLTDAIIDVAPVVFVGDKILPTSEVVAVLVNYVDSVMRFLLNGQHAEERTD